MHTQLPSSLLVLGVLAAGPAALALGDKSQWEYAELTFRTAPGRPAGADADGKATPAVPLHLSIRWVTGAGEVEARGWDELAEKLNVAGFKNGTTAFKKIQILNHLGRDGWELVDNEAPAVTGAIRGTTTSGTPPTILLLKRRVP